MMQQAGFQPGHSSQNRTAGSPLTKREWEVLWMISRGHDNKGIAETLGIRIQTVKNHTSNVLGKMQAKNRTHAAMMAIGLGWLDFPVIDTAPPLLNPGSNSSLPEEQTSRDTGRYAGGEYRRRLRRIG